MSFEPQRAGEAGLDGDRPRESLVKSPFAHSGWVRGDY